METDVVGRNIFEALADLPHIRPGGNGELVNVVTSDVISRHVDDDGLDYGTIIVHRQGGQPDMVRGHHYLEEQAILAARQAGSADDDEADRKGHELLERLRAKHDF
jgi:hypothetical protein